MTRFILTFAGLFAPLIRLLGGDVPQFLAILETKLMLDSRRPMVGFANRKDRNSGGAFSGAMMFYAIIGFFLGGMLYRVGSPLVGMTIVHTTILVMLTMTLIADFTNVLLDTTDNAILQPRPVSGRTLFLARTAHICVYLGLLGASLSLVTMAMGTMRWSSLFALVYLLTLAANLMLCICLASLFYLVALRTIGRERIRDIILYVQIGFSVFVFGGYQFLPRLVDTTQIASVRIESQWWIYLFPPAWLAGPIDLLAGNIHRPQLLLALLACTVPPLAMLAITRGLASRFNQMLAAMETTTERKAGPQAKRARLPLGPELARLMSRRASTQSAFEFFWTILSRDRLFKARTYPSIAILFIIPLSMLLSDRRGFAIVLQELPTTQRHLFLLYLSCASFAPAIIQLRYSQYWQAAWIYEALPVARAGELLVAALGVLLLRFILPAFALLSALLLAVWGPRILPDIGLALLVTVGLSLLEGLLLGRNLPFSEQFGVREGSGRLGKNLFLLLVAAGIGGVHYLLLKIPGGVPAGFATMSLLIWVPVRKYRDLPWSAVTEGSAQGS